MDHLRSIQSAKLFGLRTPLLWIIPFTVNCVALSPALASPPIRLRCAGDPPLAFALNYASGGRTMVLTRRGQHRQLMQQPSASGTWYTAPGVSYREHQGYAIIMWPGQARPLVCTWR
jgi:hypothetical protein